MGMQIALFTLRRTSALSYLVMTAVRREVSAGAGYVGSDHFQAAKARDLLRIDIFESYFVRNLIHIFSCLTIDRLDPALQNSIEYSRSAPDRI
jgi:hypothetical protein